MSRNQVREVYSIRRQSCDISRDFMANQPYSGIPNGKHLFVVFFAKAMTLQYLTHRKMIEN
jgi:hypothetical protein